MERKLFYRTFAVLAFAAGWLCLYPWVYPKVPWLREHTRNYIPLAWFWQPAEEGDPESASAASYSQMDAELLPHSADSLAVSSDLAAVLPADAFSEANQTYQGIETLSAFFKALAEKKEQVRIAYYGDSSIEGDLITQTLRDSLQNRFGAPAWDSCPSFLRSSIFAARCARMPPTTGTNSEQAEKTTKRYRSGLMESTLPR